MEETLKEILVTLKSYGEVLRNIDQRLDTVDKLLELMRNSQLTLTERGTALEQKCQKQHSCVDETLQSLARRITNLESKASPIPGNSTGTQERL